MEALTLACVLAPLQHLPVGWLQRGGAARSVRRPPAGTKNKPQKLRYKMASVGIGRPRRKLPFPPPPLWWPSPQKGLGWAVVQSGAGCSKHAHLCVLGVTDADRGAVSAERGEVRGRPPRDLVLLGWLWLECTCSRSG